MTIFARPLPRRHPATAWSLIARGLILGLCLLASYLASAAPAGAVVTVDEGAVVGAQPRNQATLFDGPLYQNELNEVKELTPDEPEKFANAAGHPVVHGSAVYAIYWDPTYHYHDDWKEKIDEFFQGLGDMSNSLGDFMAVDTQYTDKTNQPAYNRVSFRGAAEDTESYPETGNCEDPHPIETEKVLHTCRSCLTDPQLREQLQRYIATAFGLPTGMRHDLLPADPSRPDGVPGQSRTRSHCSDFSATEQ